MRANKKLISVRKARQTGTVAAAESLEQKLALAEADLADYLEVEAGGGVARCRCVWERDGQVFYSCLACAVAGERQPQVDFPATARVRVGGHPWRSYAGRLEPNHRVGRRSA